MYLAVAPVGFVFGIDDLFDGAVFTDMISLAGQCTLIAVVIGDGNESPTDYLLRFRGSSDVLLPGGRIITFRLHFGCRLQGQINPLTFLGNQRSYAQQADQHGSQ